MSGLAGAGLGRTRGFGLCLARVADWTCRAIPACSGSIACAVSLRLVWAAGVGLRLSCATHRLGNVAVFTGLFCRELLITHRRPTGFCVEAAGAGCGLFSPGVYGFTHFSVPGDTADVAVVVATRLCEVCVAHTEVATGDCYFANGATTLVVGTFPFASSAAGASVAVVAGGLCVPGCAAWRGTSIAFL